MPFGSQLDPASDLQTITRSTRMHLPYAEILEVDRIVRNCHLIPKFGRVKEPSWTADNVTELCETFYFNTYIDLHLFVMVKARLRGCVTL